MSESSDANLLTFYAALCGLIVLESEYEELHDSHFHVKTTAARPKAGRRHLTHIGFSSGEFDSPTSPAETACLARPINLTGPQWLSFFLVEKTFAVIKLVFRGPGIVLVTTLETQGDVGEGGVAIAAGTLIGVAAERRPPHTVLNLGFVCPGVP